MSDWRITLQRVGLIWHWEVYHSGYGLASGRRLTQRRAYRAAHQAIGEFV